MFQRATKIARALATRTGTHLIGHARSLCGWVSSLWSHHQDLLASNRTYLGAVSALAASLVSQTNHRDLLAALITGILAVYAATRRGLQRRGDDPYGWDRF